MTIRIMCPNLKCRRILAVPLEARGKTIRCKNCGTKIQVPPPGVSKATVKASPANASDDDKAAPVES